MNKLITKALAESVLFSFAACQPNGSYDIVNEAKLGYTATGKTVYLEGEAFNPEGYSFVLVNNVGGTTPVDAADLAFSEISGEKVTVTYLGSLSLELSVEVEPVDHITAEIPAGTQAYAKIAGGAGSATEKYTGEITVTAYNADETLSRVLAADEFTATYDSQNAADEAEVTVTMTEGSKTPAEAPVIKVVEDTVTKIELIAPDNVWLKTVAAATDFSVTETYASGKVKEDVEVNTTNFTYASDMFTKSLDELTNYSYTIYTKDEKLNDSVTVTPHDYIASVTSVEFANGEASYEVNPGYTIPLSVYKITGKLASSAEDSDITNYFEISDNYVSLFATGDVTPTLTVKADYKKADVSVTATAKAVTVATAE